MRRTKKLILWTTGILGTLLIFLLLTLLLLPYFITLEPVRQKIAAGISQRIDGQFVFQKVDFSFFPRPHIEIRQVQVLIPEKIGLAAELITIAPQIIPLLQGKVRISLIKAEAPNITLELPVESPGKEKSLPFPSAIIQEKLPPLLKVLESEAPQLTLELQKGRLDLRVEKQSVFWFGEIQGRITLPPDQLRIHLTCKSNLWETVLITAELGSKDLNGNANIQVANLNLKELRDSLAPATFPPLEGSGGNLKIGLEIDRGNTLRGKVQASFPSLIFQHGDNKPSLKGITLSGAFQTEGAKATISLTELSLQNPRARFGGEFLVDLSAPLFHLEVSGREIEVFPAREILMGLAGKTEPMETIFDILREGRVPSVSLKTHGRSLSDLGNLKNISVQGNLVGGRIFLSESLTGLKDINFDLGQVQGEVLVYRGVLEGRNLAAQWEKAGVTKGLLRLGLDDVNPLFHLEGLADADLALFPSFLKKIVGNQRVSEELDRFRKFQGRVRGRFALGETLRSIQTRIDIQEMNLSASYDQFPYPVQIESFQGGYDSGKIAIQTLNGSMGRSSFKEISSQITLRQTPHLVVSSGSFNLAADEILTWLTSLENFKVPLKDIQALKGNVTLSSLSLQGPLAQPEKWDYRVEGTIEELDASYAPIPYPLHIGKAKVIFDGKNLNIQNLNGVLGKSVFSDISAQIDLGESPYMAIPSGRSSIVVEEIYAWLKSIARFKVHLQEIRSLNGVMALSSMNLKGPLFHPEKWDYRIAGEIEKLNLEASMLPDPLAFTAAKFEADPDQVVLRNSQVILLDTSLEVSAAGKGWQEGLRAFEGAFQGKVGPKLLEWASTRFKLPEDKRLRAPILISRAHVDWDRINGLSFTGKGQWPTGPGVFIDLVYTPEVLKIKRMLLTDKNSRADIGLTVHPKELHLEFKGNLERDSVDRILLKKGSLAGSLRGDFQAHIFSDDLLRSQAQGKLSGTGFRLSLPIGGPLTLNNFSLEADRSKIRVHSAALTWEDLHLTAEGSIDFSAEAILLDMNVSTDGLQAERIGNLLKGADPKTRPEEAGQTEPKLEAPPVPETRLPPLRGRIGIKSPYLEYERYTLKSLSLEIVLDPDEIRVTVAEAKVCGISATGTARVASGLIGLDFIPSAEGQELSSSIACLLGKPHPVSGNFNLEGRIKGQGQAKDLVSSLRGPWQLEAKDGRFHHGSILIQILGLLNLTDLIAGDKPDLGKREIKYKTLQAKGDVESGKVFIKEMAMDTPEMRVFSQGEIDLLNQRIDLVVAIAPLKTGDWIVSHIPIVGYILGGTLVSIPVKVKGNLDDPRIIPLDPAEIGSGFLGDLERAFTLPFKLIKPIFKNPEK